MKSYKSGKYVSHKGYKPFLPSFINEEIEWPLLNLTEMLQESCILIGKLNAYSELIPDIDFFIKMYATKEATTSNRIEGTRTTFDEALTPIEHIVPEARDDWGEVQNYIEALNFSIEELDTFSCLSCRGQKR